ncbi:MAG: DUF3883 domain-containing protein [Actinomycetota bacterium]|nr:DUF3883 domain-containing protein [Actinomycetota bacterium]
MSRLWVYKNNARQHHHQTSWGDWTEFFRVADGQPYAWGDSSGIGSANRRVIFTMTIGDLVLCWQSDQRAAIGTASVAEMDDYIDDDGLAQRSIILQPLEEFAAPVPILDLRKTNAELASVSAFRPGNVRTIYETTPHEAQLLLAACGVAVVPMRSPAASKASNALSEAAAVRHVTDVYGADGWTVTSREAEKIGYDLDARRGRRELHLEVKGAAGPEPRFFLTANEYACARDDPAFVLCLVTSATRPKDQKLYRWTGVELIEEGTFHPASFRVIMNP